MRNLTLRLIEMQTSNAIKCQKYRRKKEEEQTKLIEESLRLKAEIQRIANELKRIKHKYKAKYKAIKKEKRALEHKYRLYKLHHGKCVYDRSEKEIDESGKQSEQRR